MSNKTGSRSRWALALGFVILVVGVGLEGTGGSRATPTPRIAHYAILDGVVRALLSGVIVVLVLGVGVLLLSMFGHAPRRGSRWFVSQEEYFPWWLRLTVAAAAVFFLAVVGFLFVALAPRRGDQRAEFARVGVRSTTHAPAIPSAVDHFNYLAPLLVGVALLVVFVVSSLVQQGSRRRHNLDRLKARAQRGASVRPERSLGELVLIPDPREKIYACWSYAEALLTGLGIERQRYESPTEFVERIGPTLPFPPLELETIASLFVEARFSEHRLGSRDADLAYTLVALLEAACKRLLTHA